jgi:hypothetical protein
VEARDIEPLKLTASANTRKTRKELNAQSAINVLLGALLTGIIAPAFANNLQDNQHGERLPDYRKTNTKKTVDQNTLCLATQVVLVTTYNFLVNILKVDPKGPITYLNEFLVDGHLLRKATTSEILKAKIIKILKIFNLHLLKRKKKLQKQNSQVINLRICVHLQMKVLCVILRY